MTKDGLVDLPAYLGAVGDNTMLMVGSAPSTLLGMVDPIPEMAGSAPRSATSASIPMRAWAGISCPSWRSWAATA